MQQLQLSTSALEHLKAVAKVPHWQHSIFKDPRNDRSCYNTDVHAHRTKCASGLEKQDWGIQQELTKHQTNEISAVKLLVELIVAGCALHNHEHLQKRWDLHDHSRTCAMSAIEAC